MPLKTLVRCHTTVELRPSGQGRPSKRGQVAKGGCRSVAKEPREAVEVSARTTLYAVYTTQPSRKASLEGQRPAEFTVKNSSSTSRADRHKPQLLLAAHCPMHYRSLGLQ